MLKSKTGSRAWGAPSKIIDFTFWTVLVQLRSEKDRVIDTLVSCEDACSMMDWCHRQSNKKAVWFYHLVMMLWLADGQIAHLPSWIISLLSLFTPSLSYVSFLQVNAYVYFLYKSLHISFIPAVFLCVCVGWSCTVQPFHIALLYSFLFFLPAFTIHLFVLPNFSPKVPPTCPLPFVSLINIKPAPLAPLFH